MLAASLCLCSEVLKMFSLMETWNLMNWLTLALELCLSGVSMTVDLNCVRIEATVNLQFVLKAALTAEARQLNFLRVACPVNVQYFFKLLLVCCILWLAEVCKEKKCEQEKILNMSDLSTSG